MIYDLIVIGAGPAGIMAAGRAGERGLSVLLIEKNPRIGAKLLLTGKGRCNLTHHEEDTKNFINQFGKNGKFLYKALNNFSIQDTLDFFHKFGIETKVERGNRIFPATGSALNVVMALEKYLIRNKVQLSADTRVLKIVREKKCITKIKTSKGDFTAKNYLLTTGGKSYPETGSTGDGLKFAEELGHQVITPKPALTPILVKESWIKELQGLNLENVNISIFQNNQPSCQNALRLTGKKQDERFGEALFTHEGMSGPIILDMSKKIGELLHNGEPVHRSPKDEGGVVLQIDFKPALDFKKLDLRIQRDFQEFNNKEFKNSLNKLLPQKLIPVIVKLSNINPDKKVNSITKEERKVLIHLLKEFKLEVQGLTGFKKAIVTSGGVNLKEIDPKTMKSKIIDNLYFAGEILDLDGPTGGYNLQACWSTGYLAGESVATSTQL